MVAMKVEMEVAHTNGREVQGGRGVPAAGYNQPSCSQNKACLSPAARLERSPAVRGPQAVCYHAGSMEGMDHKGLAMAQGRERIVGGESVRNCVRAAAELQRALCGILQKVGIRVSVK